MQLSSSASQDVSSDGLLGRQRVEEGKDQRVTKTDSGIHVNVWIENTVLCLLQRRQPVDSSFTVGEAIPPSSCERKGADRSANKVQRNFSVCCADEEAGLRTAYGGYDPLSGGNLHREEDRM